MRFLLIVVFLSLILALLGFAMTNLATRTTVTLWQTTIPDVPLWAIVYVSVLAGIISVGIIGVVDGGLVRLRNRQMAREIRRLETELNFIRTQPIAARREPEAGESTEDTVGTATALVSDDDLASAPVYHADDVDEDDPYTGGRAV